MRWRSTGMPSDDGPPPGPVARLDPGGPWWRARALVWLGVILTAAAWLGHPYLALDGAAGPPWPWEVVRAAVAHDAPADARGVEALAVPLGGALVTVLLLVAALLPSRPRRGAFLFLVAGVGAIVYWDDVRGMADASTVGLHVAGALVAGAVLLRDGVGAGRGRRAHVLGPMLLLAGLLFVPRSGAGDYADYDPVALDFIAPFQALAAHGGELGLGRLWSGDGLHGLGLGLLVLLGLAGLLGMGGRWMRRAAVALVLLAALAPIALPAPAAPPGTVDLLHALAAPAWNARFGLVLVLLAALLSLLGLLRRWRTACAALGLAWLTIVVTARAFAVGMAESAGVTAFRAGLADAALWLGPALVALLAPLAAGVLDQGAPGGASGQRAADGGP